MKLIFAVAFAILPSVARASCTGYPLSSICIPAESVLDGTLSTGVNVFITTGSLLSGKWQTEQITNTLTSSMTISGIGLTGKLQMLQRTMSQLAAITPAIGDAYLCSNCAIPGSIAVATGTAAGNFGIVAPVGVLQ